MQKRKQYRSTRFDSKTLSAAEKLFRSLASTTAKITYASLKVESGDAEWSFNTLDEFLAAADLGPVSFHVFELANEIELSVSNMGMHDRSMVSVSAPTRDKIESVFAVFDNNVERCRVPEQEEQEEQEEPRVFIGHGRDPQWRDLKDHLHEKHDYDVEAYEIGSRAGHTIRDILEEMLEESSFALLVMTGEDETIDGKFLARQNVVHEAGLFQGKLGFSRAIILLEAGTEEFSNIHGLQQIRFSKGNIKESFGEVLAVLRREFG